MMSKKGGKLYLVVLIVLLLSMSLNVFGAELTKHQCIQIQVSDDGCDDDEECGNQWVNLDEYTSVSSCNDGDECGE